MILKWRLKSFEYSKICLPAFKIFFEIIALIRRTENQKEPLFENQTSLLIKKNNSLQIVRRIPKFKLEGIDKQRKVLKYNNGF